MHEPNQQSEPQPTSAPKQQRCRYIKTGGEQCGGRAMIGHHYCWHHRWNGKPQFAGVKGFDRTPLLEDTASIQDLVSRTMQGLLEGKLSENGARVAFYGAAVANAVLRTDIQRRRFLAEHEQRPEEPVAEATNLDSEPLAPAQDYRGPENKFEPTWSFSKYRYEEECKRLGKALPQSAADMPVSGWITEEEEDEEIATWAKRYEDKIDAMQQAIKDHEAEESAAALAAGLPDPHPKPRFDTACPYGIDWCAGDHGTHRCCYCKGVLDWNGIHPDQPPIDPPDYSPLAHGAEPRYNTADWLRRKAEDAANQTRESNSRQTEDSAASAQCSTLDLKAEAAVPELSALSPVKRPATGALRCGLWPVACGLRSQWPAACGLRKGNLQPLLLPKLHKTKRDPKYSPHPRTATRVPGAGKVLLKDMMA